MFSRANFLIIVCILLLALLGAAYVSLNAKYKSNASLLSEFNTRLEAIDRRSENQYSDISDMLTTVVERKSSASPENENSIIKNDTAEIEEKFFNLIRQQNLYLEKLSSRINNMQTQMLLNENSQNSADDSNTNINRPEPLTIEQMDLLTNEELRQNDLRFNELEVAFLEQVENTHWGNNKTENIITGIEELKQNPEYQNFKVTDIDCRVTQCKIELLHEPESHNQELVIMELLTKLDGELLNIEINQQNNADGSTSAVYYLSKN